MKNLFRYLKSSLASGVSFEFHKRYKEVRNARSIIVSGHSRIKMSRDQRSQRPNLLRDAHGRLDAEDVAVDAALADENARVLEERSKIEDQSSKIKDQNQYHKD